jgi:hypothetical protein
MMPAPTVTYDEAAGVLTVEVYDDTLNRIPLADRVAYCNRPPGCTCRGRMMRLPEGEDVGGHAVGRVRYHHHDQCRLKVR